MEASYDGAVVVDGTGVGAFDGPVLRFFVLLVLLPLSGCWELRALLAREG
jgi:hypothetical protein